MKFDDNLPSKAEIFEYWKDRFPDVGMFIDWGEPSCWACGFHYGAKYDIKKPKASWSEILRCWERMPLQRCHIVPRSLGGTDDPANLVLMCRECHDLAPNTDSREIFFQWVCKQSYLQRDWNKILPAFEIFDLKEENYGVVAEIANFIEFRSWASGKMGLHRPQSNYASRLARLTPATLIGLVVQYQRELAEAPLAAGLSGRENQK